MDSVGFTRFCFLFGLVVLASGAGFWALLAVIVASMLIGVRRLVLDRRELRITRNYCRIKRIDWLGVGSGLMVLGLWALSPFLDGKIGSAIEGVFSSWYWPILLAPHAMASYYSNFAYSLRWFEEGVKTPDRTEHLIRWSQISAVEVDGRRVSISYGNENRSWRYKKEDREDLEDFVRTWEINFQEIE